MNKSDLVDAVAGSADMSKAEAGRAVDAVLDGISGALGRGDSVALVGFGTFSVRHRAARKEECMREVVAFCMIAALAIWWAVENPKTAKTLVDKVGTFIERVSERVSD